jgi:hypothetical protein
MKTTEIDPFSDDIPVPAAPPKLIQKNKKKLRP